MHIGTSLIHVPVFYIFIWHKGAAIIAGVIFPWKEAADDEQKDLLLNLSNTEMKKVFGRAVLGHRGLRWRVRNAMPAKWKTTKDKAKWLSVASPKNSRATMKLINSIWRSTKCCLDIVKGMHSCIALSLGIWCFQVWWSLATKSGLNVVTGRYACGIRSSISSRYLNNNCCLLLRWSYDSVSEWKERKFLARCQWVNDLCQRSMLEIHLCTDQPNLQKQKSLWNHSWPLWPFFTPATRSHIFSVQPCARAGRFGASRIRIKTENQAQIIDLPKK